MNPLPIRLDRHRGGDTVPFEVDAERPGERLQTTATAAAISAAGVLLVLLVTRWGIGTSVDSAAYIQAARGLAQGSGEAPLVQHAPLYAFLLAAGGWAGLEPMDGARWLNAMTFGLNIFLVGLLIRRSSTHVPWAWAFASTLMLVLVPMLATHITALSEPVFLACSLTGFLLVARSIEEPSTARVMAAGAAIGLSLLARYAGAACVLTGAIAILWTGQGATRQRLQHAGLFTIVAAVPMAAWIVRNLMIASTATGRDLAFHPVGWAHAWQALYTASGWLLIPPGAPDAIRFVVWLAIGGCAAWGALRTIRAAARVPAVVRVMTMFTFVYAAFLITSISFVDANTPLDDRILLPILAAALVLASYLLDMAWPLIRQRRTMAYAGIAIVVLLTGGHALHAAEMAVTGYEQGWGFNSVAWQRSPTLGRVGRLDTAVPVYSNAPEIIYLHSGRQVRRLPRSLFLMNRQVNPAFDAQLDEVGREIRNTCGVVVFVRNLAQRAVPGEEEFRRRLDLDVVWTAEDGVIWGVASCQR